MRTKNNVSGLSVLAKISLLIIAAFTFWVLLHRAPRQEKDVYPYLLSISPNLVKICAQEIGTAKTVSWEDLLAVRSTLSEENARPLIEQLQKKIAFTELTSGTLSKQIMKDLQRHREILIRYPFLTPNKYRFPVVGKTWFEDSFGADREGGKRRHEGTDLFGAEGTPIINCRGGIIEQLGWNRLGGERVGIRGDDGNYYYYAHLQAISPKLVKGKRLETGEPIGSMGHTGDALTTPDHLHFGIELPDGEWIDPYSFLAVWQFWEESPVNRS
ncbi:M23 family metallopeptidase [Desulfosporosinus sp. PR]|uniref:M23 family metallopeptidase n=1 Tax=Candidatus Desulfosporosinus nitrosoreducens TaxID=3401928 RepID=UPI0027FCAC13|nr:M23 family metallopeptidase [Desulfosporosinus sp. PR]MDQ7092732.1 M23 family metallopeptidase [Desulfosporosinus sp. PR]